MTQCRLGEEQVKKVTLSKASVDLITDVPLGREDLIIPILQKIQGIEGYIPEEGVNLLARQIGITPVRIFGVATFYNQFRLTPLGKHVIKICRGTACHVKGSGKLLDFLCNSLNIKTGETTKDGLFTIEEVACLGACSIAPAIMIDDKFYGRVTNTGMMNLIEALKTGAEA